MINARIILKNGNTILAELNDADVDSLISIAKCLGNNSAPMYIRFGNWLVATSELAAFNVVD